MGTHLNAYKTEATDALSKVHVAVQEAEEKLNALLVKLEEATGDVAETAPVEAPAEVAQPAEVAPRAADGKFAPKG